VPNDDRLTALKSLMKKHKLNCPQVAALLGRKPQTVRAWRSGRFPVPEFAITLLELRFGQ
jgi:DNA-binding transcriptional regulator YiaG